MAMNLREQLNNINPDLKSKEEKNQWNRKKKKFKKKTAEIKGDESENVKDIYYFTKWSQVVNANIWPYRIIVLCCVRTETTPTEKKQIRSL